MAERVDDADAAWLIVDAMNVIGSRPTGWWRDRPGAIRALARRLEALARERGWGITLVVDGRELPGLPEGDRDAIEVVYARRRGPNAADDRIVELVQEDDAPESLRVVTSDRELRRRVEASGAAVVGAGWLLDRLPE